MATKKSFQMHEPAFRTQYAELKERTRSAGKFLSGTPGSLTLKTSTGYRYWYRVYYSAEGKRIEDIVCKDGDIENLRSMKHRIADAEWALNQVRNLRNLGFQVADKLSGSVVVELHNSGAFEAGLVLVGTYAFMAILNELGAKAVSSKTMDIDLARGQPLEPGAALSFLDTMKATGLPFLPIPGLSPKQKYTSVKLPGSEGLRVDLLAPGRQIGSVIDVPELNWSAQAIPHLEYLIDNPDSGAALAGPYCVPVKIPQAARFALYKLYSSTERRDFPEKAQKDFQQGLLVSLIVASEDPQAMRQAFKDAPPHMLNAIRLLRVALKSASEGHDALSDLVDGFLLTPKAKRRARKRSQ